MIALSVTGKLNSRLLIVGLLTLCASLPVRAEEAPLLAAASSLRSLWPALVDSYRTSESRLPAPRASFASSGLLSTQIINGAPFELFLSADQQSIERLPRQRLASEPQRFALGELLLVAPEAGSLAKNLSMQTLARTFVQARESSDHSSQDLRLAIANPDHAPYGKAAREALQSAGLWPVPTERLLLAENAAQTVQFVRTGAVSAALIPKALLPSATAELVMVDVPAGTYQPVQHTVVLLSEAKSAASHFYHWLLGDDAREALLAAGLKVPAP